LNIKGMFSIVSAGVHITNHPLQETLCR